jgi:D-alanyl-D-alanine carboxypeptidase
MTKGLSKLLMISVGLSLSASISQAKVSMNAMCYMNVDDSTKTISGTATDKEFELASTSKVVTSFWAINKLGAKYRFTTKLYITPVAADTYDIHVQGDKDPYFGQQMVYFLVSELNKNGIKKVENLTFDENLEINWNVADPQYQARRSYDPQPEAVRGVLENMLIKDKFTASTYNQFKTQVKNQTGIQMAASAGLQIRRINYVSSSDYRPEEKTKVLLFRSAPLYQYLKFMNLHSNNYMADMLFAKLGGAAEFKKFMQTRLDLDNTDINFVNGSGDSIYADKGKLYNKASCATMIKVLIAMRSDLNKQGLDLSNMMSVAGTDNSTLGGRYANMKNSAIAKTGSVDPAITLAGMVATGKGNLVFAVMMKTGGPADWTNARNQIREKVGSIVKQNNGLKTFKYATPSVLPVDKYSILTPQVTSSKN